MMAVLTAFLDNARATLILPHDLMGKTNIVVKKTRPRMRLMPMATM